MRKCPKDNTQLKSTSLKGVTVDICPKCTGIFFDRAELKRAKDATDEDLRFLDFDLFEDRNDRFIKYNTGRKCPKDNMEMIGLRYADSKIQIEKCIECDGVWLDGGEFEKIVKYLEKKATTMTSGELGEHALKELTSLAQGSEDIGQELKDLLSVLKLYETRLEAEHPTAETWIRRLIAYWPIH